MLKNRITEIRKAKKIGLEELAEKAGLSAGYVSLMASGGRNISLKNLAKLAKALDCEPQDLISNAESNETTLLNLWASIPAERRDLALQVLQSFASTSVDMAKLSIDAKKKNK